MFYNLGNFPLVYRNLLQPTIKETSPHTKKFPEKQRKFTGNFPSLPSRKLFPYTSFPPKI